MLRRGGKIWTALLHKRAAEPVTPDEYLGQCMAVLWEVESRVPEDRTANARRLISHGECPIGLAELAWSITTSGVRVPRQVVVDIRRLVEGTEEEDGLPPQLDDFALDE